MGLRSWTETQALTRAVANPNSDAVPATSGMDLAGVYGFEVTVSAASGQTLTGGTLFCWKWNPKLGRWVRNKDLDLVIPASIGIRDVTWGQLRTLAPIGRVLYATSAVTVSGGTTVDVRIDAYGGTFAFAA